MSVAASPHVLEAERLDELEVPAGHPVEEHLRSRAADPRPVEVAGAPGLELRDVGDERPGRAHEEPVFGLEPEALEGVDAVAAEELVAGGGLVEEPVVADDARGDGVGPRSGEAGGERVFEGGGDDDLGGPEPAELPLEGVGVDGLDDELPRREVGGRESQAGARARREKGEEVVPPRIEEGVIEHGAGGDRLDHLAADEPLRPGSRILHLLADRRPAPEPDQARQVVVERLRGNAGKRDAGRRPVVPGGEREAEKPRALLGVLPEELVEVSHPEEEQRVRVAALHLPPLAHERGLPPARAAPTGSHPASRPSGRTRRSRR